MSLCPIQIFCLLLPGAAQLPAKEPLDQATAVALDGTILGGKGISKEMNIARVYVKRLPLMESVQFE